VASPGSNTRAAGRQETWMSTRCGRRVVAYRVLVESNFDQVKNG